MAFNEHPGLRRGAPEGNSYIIPNPTIIERTGRGERHYDIWSRLLEDRIVFLGTPIDDNVANIIIGQLLHLQKTDRNRDVHLYINSPGGYISSGLAIYDTLQYISCPIETVCIGNAASMAAILLAAGDKGKRYALPNSRIMIHQPAGGVQGTAADIEIEADEILKNREILNRILAQHTGRTEKQVEDDTDRNKYLAAEEAREYGLIDEVLQSLKDRDAKDADAKGS
ncbi:MAG: ATP-dependent Clp protease proteolytic subunit [Planctomycetota bacterium]